MPKYPCKEEGCDGTVSFPDKEEPSEGDKRLGLIIIVDKPSQCSKCPRSYYEHELRDS